MAVMQDLPLEDPDVLVQAKKYLIDWSTADDIEVADAAYRFMPRVIDELERMRHALGEPCR